jgi:hypothetical protein
VQSFTEFPLRRAFVDASVFRIRQRQQIHNVRKSELTRKAVVEKLVCLLTPIPLGHIAPLEAQMKEVRGNGRDEHLWTPAFLTHAER